MVLKPVLRKYFWNQFCLALFINFLAELKKNIKKIIIRLKSVNLILQLRKKTL